MFGTVRDGDEDDDPPMPNVTIKITGDKEGYKGPYYATTASDGKYSIVFGSFGDIGDAEFRASIYGDGVDNDDAPKWKTTENCDLNDSTQVVKVNWGRR